MNLTDISFPVYYLGKKEPENANGIRFYFYLKEEDDGIKNYIISLIDDPNVEGDTLAKRRITLLKQGEKLYKLKYAIFFIADLIKFTKGTTWFIDSTGKIFSYKKTKKVPLIFKKVNRITPIRTGGALVEVDKIPNKFKVLFLPPIETKAAGLLQTSNGYVLYGLYDKIYDKTTRMI